MATCFWCKQELFDPCFKVETSRGEVRYICGDCWEIFQALASGAVPFHLAERLMHSIDHKEPYTPLWKAVCAPPPEG